MHVGNQMVSGTTLQTNMADTRSKNVVIHSENCKVENPLDITAQQLASTKQVRRLSK